MIRKVCWNITSRCNRNCPYCIAKNNKKFGNLDHLDNLDYLLKSLLDNNIRFNRFVISGNGEPSLYDMKTLNYIYSVLNDNKDLFKYLRVHSSGNLFFDDEKIEMIKKYNFDSEVEVLRISFDPQIDSSVLGYKDDYLTSNNFDEIKIKCDIALTDYLDVNNIDEQLYSFINKHKSVDKIRFKKLLIGDHMGTPQAVWVNNHTLSNDKIDKIISILGLKKRDGNYYNGNIVFSKNGIYGKDVVINNGMIQDYNHNTYKAKELRKKYE